ncbi:MAG TPA: hypothetical protein VK900_16730 [Anaerolineales bacterium]|nr:hypothetical protein [Anaerolineales bacterium]
MSGPFGVRMTLISAGQQSGETVVAAATFLSMGFLTIDCVCTDRYVPLEFLTALSHFTGRPGIDPYESPDSFVKALVEPATTLSTEGLFWLALDKAGEKLARDIFHFHGELAKTRVYHSVHKLNLIEPPVSLPVHGWEREGSGEEAIYGWFESLYEAILPWRQIVKNIQSDFS